MNKITKTLIFAALIWALFSTSEARAQVISPSSEEVLFSYQTDFEISASEAGDAALEQLSLDHANYLFGVMSSIELAGSYGIDSTVVEGAGAPRSDMQIRVISSQNKGKVLTIRYAVSGRMLVHKKVARVLLKDRVWRLPLPVNGKKAFKVQCTDEHYKSFGDFWYFWDPYRAGCESLQDAPLAKTVEIHISPVRQKKFDEWARLDLLRGANGNGDLFSIYVIHGFDESSTDKKDAGRITFDTFNAYLLEKGFQETVKFAGLKRPLKVYTKTVTLPQNKKITIEIKSQLADTEMETKGVTFAKFFKEAVAQADVIYYSGHSGLGSNLSIPLLEEKAGGFTFPKNKRQIFYFEACSSYSYYLTHFSAHKTRAKIDILSNGLASYFETANDVLHAFMDVLISDKMIDIQWLDFLKRIEKPLEGRSFLLNVGGV
jgi:hypothetical protein